MRDSGGDGRHGGVNLPTDGLPAPSLNGRVLKPIWISIVSAVGSKVNDEADTNGRSLEEAARGVDQTSEWITTASAIPFIMLTGYLPSSLELLTP